MDPFATSHFSKAGLRLDLKSRAARDHADTAILLTRIAEYDRRKLFLEDGYPSMYAYCIRELNYSEGEAYRFIHAARTVRRYPGALVALSDGRLHLRAVLMLAPHLRPSNADELVAAATHQTRAEIQLMLARRFPRPDLPERLAALPAPAAIAAQPAPEPPIELTPEQVPATIPDEGALGEMALPPEPASELTPEQVAAAERPARTMPLSPERFGLQCTLDRETHDLLREAQELMSHQNPTGEIVTVLHRALRLLVDDLRRRKFAATTRPGRARPTHSPRHIPADVKRTVWARDGGRCAFVSDAGKRCPARALIEFDHTELVARGGQATADKVRLLCWAHNQHAAERELGAEFMNGKRTAARRESPRRARGVSASGGMRRYDAGARGAPSPPIPAA